MRGELVSGGWLDGLVRALGGRWFRRFEVGQVSVDIVLETRGQDEEEDAEEGAEGWRYQDEVREGWSVGLECCCRGNELLVSGAVQVTMAWVSW